MEKENLFKWKHYHPDLILLTVRWLQYKLSLRDLTEMMEEHRLSTAHTTLMRWIHRYDPELDERIRSMLGLKSFHTTKSILSGIEAIHIILKKDNLFYRTSLSKIKRSAFTKCLDLHKYKLHQ